MKRAHSSATVRGGGSGGFSIVAAIFLLVVLAALGAAIVIVSTTQQISSALDMQGTRAYHAARAGIDWGLYRVTRDGINYRSSVPTDVTMTSIPPRATNILTWCTGTSATPTVASFALPATATSLAGFTVTVSCYATQTGTSAPWVIRITSTACNQPLAGWTAATVACPGNVGSLYIERRMEVTL